MIPVRGYDGHKVAVLGLGRSGLPTVRALRAGDTLIVWKLDRLGRNLTHLVETVNKLNARGVGFKVLTGQGASIDTTTANAAITQRFGRVAEGAHEDGHQKLSTSEGALVRICGCTSMSGRTPRRCRVCCTT